MRDFFKKGAIVLLVLMAVFAFVGCDNAAGGSSGSGSGSGSGSSVTVDPNVGRYEGTQQGRTVFIELKADKTFMDGYDINGVPQILAQGTWSVVGTKLTLTHTTGSFVGTSETATLSNNSFKRAGAITYTKKI